MNSQNLTSIVKRTKSTLRRHGSEILTGLGITGMIATTIMAVRATPKAMKIINGELHYRNRPRNEGEHKKQIEKLPAKEVIKCTWKCYVPAVITGTASIACIIGANSLNARQNAALAAAYTLSESALKVYKDKVIETIGEEREKEVRDKVARERVISNPVSDRDIFVTGNGETLCLESISGRYFKSDVEAIKRAENAANKLLLNDSYITLNDFYYELGLDGTSMGNDLGWSMDDGLIDINFNSQLTDKNVPCLVIEYRLDPRFCRQ
jgi:hypothetical protein